MGCHLTCLSKSVYKSRTYFLGDINILSQREHKLWALESSFYLCIDWMLLIRWPKYWSFSSNISPSSGYSGLISFRMNWLDLLAAQGTLNSLLQHHSSKASILQCSAFFIVQLLHPYMTTEKTIALTRRTFVGKVMSLHFNLISSLIITFLHSF